MTPLPTTFRRDQFDFKQIADFHPVYIYEKRKGSWVGYEVIIARKRGERIWKERTFSAHWAYPSSEDWGAYGWSCQTIGRAYQKAAELAKPCPHDPRTLAGAPIGQYHCPTCGEMVIAGMPHEPEQKGQE